MADYHELRAQQAAARAEHARTGRGPLVGIGLSFFTEAVGAGPRRLMDMGGLGMADGADLRIHPSGSAVLAVSCMSQGQGHETTFAQIVSHELGIDTDEVLVVQGDTDRTPFGLGTYGSRSTPVSGAAAVVVARKVRERARLVAAAMLEVDADDLEWTPGRWQVRGVPDSGTTLAEIAMAVVASHGRDEAAVLQAALAARVPYVALVASRRRADGVRAELVGLGVPAEQVDRMSSPAGLDIGSRSAPEIALSVFAEMVAARARDRSVPAPPPAPVPEPSAAATDPVCGMAVAPVPASPSVQHGGRTFWFCGSGCRQAFADDPSRFTL